MSGPALFARFPKPFWWHPDPDDPWADDQPIIPRDAAERFPSLAVDLRLWQEELEVPFRRLDHQAQLLQQQFWRQRTTLILGGLLATVLGAVQGALGGSEYVAAAQAVVTGLLTGVATLVSGRRAQQGYLMARLRAERIKSEFFLFLGRAGEYAGAERERLLGQRVDDILDAEDVA